MCLRRSSSELIQRKLIMTGFWSKGSLVSNSPVGWSQSTRFLAKASCRQVLKSTPWGGYALPYCTGVLDIHFQCLDWAYLTEGIKKIKKKSCFSLKIIARRNKFHNFLFFCLWIIGVCKIWYLEQKNFEGNCSLWDRNMPPLTPYSDKKFAHVFFQGNHDSCISS